MKSYLFIDDNYIVNPGVVGIKHTHDVKNVISFLLKVLQIFYHQIL